MPTWKAGYYLVTAKLANLIAVVGKKDSEDSIGVPVSSKDVDRKRVPISPQDMATVSFHSI